MSFSSKVKEELSTLTPGKEHCVSAELIAIITMCGKVTISAFDNHIIYQRKLNEVALCHIVCNGKEYYHEIVKNICDELSRRFEPIEKKLMEIKKESE